MTIDGLESSVEGMSIYDMCVKYEYINLKFAFKQQS